MDTETTFYLSNTYDIDINTLEIHDSVTSIAIRCCRLRNINNEFFKRFTKLETIDLHGNALESLNFFIPDTVTNLDVSYNKIYDESFIGFNLGNLEYINLEYNFLSCVPDIIKNIRFNTNGNSFSDQRRIIKNVMNQYSGQPVYRQIQQEQQQLQLPPVNVHETIVQNNTMKSIKYLIKTYDEIPYNINYLTELKMYISENSSFWYYFYTIDGLCKNGKFFKLLNLYDTITNQVIYDYSNESKCKIHTLLERIWETSKNKKDINSIVENLYYQMSEGKDVCFVGKYTRIINTLSSFDENIEQDIPFSEKFSIELTKLKAKYVNNNYIIRDITEFVKNSNISEEDRTVWIDAIKEEF